MHAPIRSLRPTKEETRERILAAADGLFRQYGIGKTTVADVARELGMSPANVYKFFASKNALAQASADRNLALVRKAVTDIARAERKSVARRIEEIVLTVFRFHQELFRNERQIYRMVIQAVEEAWPCIDEYYEFLRETFQSLLKEGMARGEVRASEVNSLAVALMDALHAGFNPHFRHRWSPTESETRVRAHIRFVLRGL